MDQPGGDWLHLAGIALIMAGILRFFDALWALLLPSHLEGAIFRHSTKSYGWIYLLVAIILCFSGLSVVARAQFARWIGVIAAAIGGISAIWWMPYYSVWSLAFVGMCIFVIYALVAHGKQESVAIR